MSEFTLIIPSGWTQLDWQYLSSNFGNLSYPAVMNGVLSDIEFALKEAEAITQAQSLLEFKLIDDTYFLVRLG